MAWVSSPLDPGVRFVRSRQWAWETSAMGDTPAHPAWPGISANKTLLLHIDPRHWAPPRRPILVDGLRFEPKTELHVTLFGRKALARLLGGPLARRRRHQKALRAAFEACDWRWRRTGRLDRLQRREPDGGGVVGSIIEHIELPGLATFHALLQDLVDDDMPDAPPPHVTLYTMGRPEGIGVQDAVALQRLRVREIARSELHAVD